MSKRDIPKVLLQLTDLHTVPKGQEHSSWARVEAFTLILSRWIDDLSIQPDAVIITGDLVDDGRVESYEHFKNILEPLKMPVYVLPGNHDDRVNLKAVCSRFIGDAASSEAEFIQYVVNVGGMRLIALDTLKTGVAYGALCEKRLQWLEATLAQEPDTPTIVAMHHPPFKTGMVQMDQMRLIAGAEQLESIFLKNKQIQRLICGHQHRGSMQCFGQTLAVVAPSASHQLTLQLKDSDPFGYTQERPGAAMHIWNETDFCVSTHFFGVEGVLNKIVFEPIL